MRQLFRKIIIAGLAATPLFGAYSYRSAVTFTGATGSTQSNITLLFSFGDAKLKAAASGGHIQNLCSRNGSSVPCDFVFTDDATCATLTGGYTWGFDGDYSATAGTGHGWITIPSYTTSGVTPTLCIGNSVVNTYQGGSVGAEFDSSTAGVWHLPNGSSLNLTDFSANNVTTTNLSATATTGQIDGGAAFAGGARISAATNTGFNSASFSVSCWFQTSTSGTYMDMVRRDDGGGNRSFLLRIDTTNKVTALLIYGGNPSVTSSSAYTDGSWHLATMTVSVLAGVSTLTLFVDGASQGTATASATNPSISQSLDMGGYASGENWHGSLDEVVFASTTRSANWVASQYANQSTPPAVAGFTILSSGTAPAVPAAIY